MSKTALVRFGFFSAVLLTSAQTLAQGYFAGQKGARVAGRAGAFVVKADDLSAADYNPAGFSRMRGYRAQLSNRFAYNYVSYQRAPVDDGGTATYFRKVENQLPLQGLDPLLGIAADFGLEDWGFGLTVNAPPGIGRLSFPVGPDLGEDPTLGPLNGGQRYMMVSREAEILVYSLSAAWKFRELFGVGASLQWIHVPRLTYSLVVDGHPFPRPSGNPVSSQFDILSTVSGSDPFTFNANVGAWVKPTKSWEVGLSGQVVPAQIETESHLDMDLIGREGNVTLTRNGYAANDVRLTLPLPLTARAGVRYLHHASDDRVVFDVELDVIYQTWSRVPSFNVAMNGLQAEIEGVGQTDVQDVVIQKQWRDTVSVHLGGDWNAIPNLLTLRGGVAYESAASHRQFAHVDFATGEHLSGALGASLLLGGFELALAYGYRHQIPIDVAAGEGYVYQEVPEEPCTQGGICVPVNEGRHQAFSHTLSLDAIYQF